MMSTGDKSMNNAEMLRGPAYRIETQRLVLRCWDPVDAPLLKQAVEQSLDHLLPWMPWARHEPEELQIKIDRLRRFRGQFDLGQDYIYGIFNADETAVLGGTGLHTWGGIGAREIGYWIHKDYLNQGLATEVSAALTKIAIEIECMNRVEIHCVTDNVRSAAVPRKLGFTHEATLRERIPGDDGQLNDMMIWTILASEYPNSPAASAEIKAFDAIGRQLL
jgi:RimJ/RimL family protein N-acetyltransferase